MELTTTDVHSYNLSQLMNLFKLGPSFTDEELQLSKQRLIADIPNMRSTTMTRPHEIALFIDCACNRLRDESNQHSLEGTWQQKTNPLIKGGGSHVLQESQNRIMGRKAGITSGRYADSDDTPPGWLNPINIKTTDMALNVDSRFRNDYGGTSSSDWSIDLPVTLNKVTTMRVTSLEMPLSFYAVSMALGNSTFLAVNQTREQYTNDKTGKYNLSDPSNPIDVRPFATSVPTSQAWLVIIPDGNYELGWQDLSGAEDIVRAMISAIEIAIPGDYDCASGEFRAQYTLAQWIHHAKDADKELLLSTYLAYDVNRKDGKSIFASPGSQGNGDKQSSDDADPLPMISLEFAVDRGGCRDLNSSLQMKLGWLLGFRVGTYYTKSSLGHFSYISESICNLEGPRYMYLCITDGTNNHGSSLVGCFAQSTFNKDIMLRINLAAGTYGVKVFKYFSLAGIAGSWWRSRSYYGPVTIKKLRFRLYDEFGRLLDLNGLDWSMAIVFDQLYD